MEVFIALRAGLRIEGKDAKEIHEKLMNTTISEIDNQPKDSYLEFTCIEDANTHEDLGAYFVSAILGA